MSGIYGCEGLAVEWRTSQLYWTDTISDTISISDLNGNNRRTIISSGLDKPRAIALDLDSGYMFWTDWGGSPKIERASLSGSQRLAIVTTNLQWPNGIDLDEGNKRIYWVDAKLDKVECVDYNGHNRKVILQYNGLHPFGVALVPPFLFFTDWATLKEFHQLDATTGEILRSHSINGGHPMGIVPYDSTRQPSGGSSCAAANGGCSHFCVPKTSGYECVCPTGLTVKKDGKTCGNRMKNFLLFADADANTTNIISLDVSYHVAQVLFRHLGKQRPIALDFDSLEDRVYWSDTAQGLIISAFFNVTGVKILFRSNVLTPEGLVISHMSRTIYWTDTGTNRIEVGSLDGTRRKLLFKDGLDEPRAIILNERNGTMYWTDWGANPKIEKAGMDGSRRRSIVTRNLVWPNGLTVDQAANLLFWADAKLDTIEMSDLDGGSRKAIMSSAADIHPFGLALYRNVLYWTDWVKKSISSLNLTSRNQQVVVTGLQKPMDIRVFDSSLDSGSHPCAQNSGNCSDLCLLRPGGYQCSCSTGMVLKPDGRSCDFDSFHATSSEKFLIFAEADSGEIYKIPLTVREKPCYPLKITKNISRPVAVDYDPTEDKIYWTDVTLKVLARAFPNGTSVELISHINVDTPDGIAVDFVGRNLYWTDAGTSKIEVAWLDGSYRRALITSSIEKPRAIMLDIQERKMYWSDWGTSPKIEQANMDGSDRTVLVSSGIVWVNSLAIDFQNSLLYWCDAKLDKIERVNLQGNNRVVVLDLSPSNLHPFGLALADHVLYWSDWNNQSVHTYNMTSNVSDVLVLGMGRPMELHIHNEMDIYKVNRCQQLFAPNHGSREPCSNLPGKTCQFSCDRGYILAGSSTRTCSNDGTWTGTQTQCNPVTCPPLTTPPKAVIFNASCGNTYGSNCKFGCESGYGDPSGNETRTCLHTGNWSTNIINCTDWRSDIISTHISDILFPSFGATCPQGPLLIYAERGRFSAYVNWTEPVAVDNSGVVAMTSNYQPPQRFNQGTHVITYSAEDQSGNRAICSFTIKVIVINCTALMVNSGDVLRMSSCSSHYGAQCNFSCPTGYRLNGSSTVQCVSLANKPPGFWDSPSPTCKMIKCGPLVPPKNGIVFPLSCQSSSNYTQTCQFACQTPGYVLDGTVSRVCNNRGSWTGSNDTRCRDNTPPSFHDTCPGNMVVYAPECSSTASVNWIEPTATDNSGHLTIGYPLIRPPINLSIGLYYVLYSASDSSKNRVNCTFIVQIARKSCVTLEPPINGVVLFSCGSSFGSEAVVTCKKGFRIVGYRQRFCKEDGQWSGNMTKCENIQPPSIRCPSALEKPTETGQSYARVTWNIPVPTDNSKKQPILSGLMPPQKLNVGRNYINYIATDSSGLKSFCRFAITVKDLEPPKISSCPSGIHITSAKKLTQVFLPGVVVTDNVGVFKFMTSRPNGSDFTWGKHNITYTALDAAGNRATCDFRIEITDLGCTELRSPFNGAKACDLWLDAGKMCTLHCNDGYDFAHKPPSYYTCGIRSRKWLPNNEVPDCSKTRPAKTLLDIQLYYLANQCSEEIHSQISSNFIALYVNFWGPLIGCGSAEECEIGSVHVECGDQTGILKKRDVEEREKKTQVFLKVRFSLKVPLPINTSVEAVNETAEEISEGILRVFNDTNLSMNISGNVLEYDTSKVPQIRLERLLCDQGQVLKETKCVNCPVGYFFNTTDCEACGVDQYQDKEAQSFCFDCPPGTRTFGGRGSKKSGNCEGHMNFFLF
ncbi:Low-density lipoprotein receptor-related protein 6 [Stylophora pistillata]|uniref:Low-density lipoprotein receptor-related protein 6 n=1 Tax=Stylophora pistillata TaxID=50429 RepID=A0A2B4S2S9_STYPI|nr:Low-density lipoprotein receptor-related protein 6 [Stylophora pistillata]